MSSFYKGLSKPRGALLSALLMMGLIINYFSPVIFQPTEYWLVAGGDGTKNYFVPAYYAKYDSGLRFTAMNYPYDEHILFTDGHFPISYFLQLLQRTGLNVSDYTVPVINYALLLSLIVAAVFVFLLLVELGVSVWFAVFASVCIALLSPQLQRMVGHYSMGYVCYFPMLLYFLHRQLTSSNVLGWTVASFLTTLFFGLLHSYVMAIGAAFLLSFAFCISLLAYATNRFRWRLLVIPLITALVPLVLLQTFIALTDTAANERVKVPWGFEYYHASWTSVFLPPEWSHFNYFKQPGTGEGYGFIGVVALVGVIAFAFRQLIRFRIRRAGRLFVPTVNLFVLAGLFAGFIVLLHAMLYPWRWNLLWLANEMPLLVQFRSIGRFSWAFYYASGIFSVYFFYVLSRTAFLRRRPWLRYGMMITVVALLFFDAQSNVKPVKRYYEMSRVGNKFWPNNEVELLLHQNERRVDEFQAILELPFHHIGTEKFWIEGQHSGEKALAASYNTGLRMINSHMGRTPLFESARVIQLTGNPLLERELLPTLSANGKPLLLLVTGDNLSAYQRNIINKAHRISSLGSVTCYELPIDSLVPDRKVVRQNFVAVKTQLQNRFGAHTMKPDDLLYYNALVDTSSDFLTNAVDMDSGRVVLFNQRVSLPWLETDSLLLSCWFSIRTEIYGFPELHVKYFDSAGKQTDHFAFTANQSHDVYNNRALLQVGLPPRNVDSISVHVIGRYYGLSEFMLRRAGSDVYTHIETDGSFVINNIPIPLP